MLKSMGNRNDHDSQKAWHEVCNYLYKDNTMAGKSGSYFVFRLAKSKDTSPKPGPEWPPVEPTPIPPVTDPVPTVPPVIAVHFQFYSFMLN